MESPQAFHRRVILVLLHSTHTQKEEQRWKQGSLLGDTFRKPGVPFKEHSAQEASGQNPLKKIHKDTHTRAHMHTRLLVARCSGLV